MNVKRFLPAAAVASLLALPAPTRAQGAGDFVTPFSNVFISVGTLLMDVSKLNQRFQRPDLAPVKTGFDAISNDAYAVGVGGYTTYGRILLGGDAQYADLGEESSSAGKTNRLETAYVMGTVGFAAYTTWRFSLYPMLGVGFGSATLTLRNRTGGPTVSSVTQPSFDDIILSPGADSKIKGSYVLLVPGIGFDYLMLNSEDSHIGVTLGIRIESAITPNRTTWTYKGRSVFGAPDAGPSGGMVRLQLGIGGFRTAGTKAPGR